MQVMLEVYNVVRIRPKEGGTEEHSGFGDTTVRVKVKSCFAILNLFFQASYFILIS
ncbi:MAG: hypothetical protein RM022_028185 [Nostoc sp. EfeVER01]